MTDSNSRHYVADYRNYVDDIESRFDHEEAMAIVVGGGDFDDVGDEQAVLLGEFGLSAGDTIVDVGCGSGRLAAALTREYGADLTYLGLDVVQDLLDYAAAVSDPSYEFLMNTELTIPAENASCDFIVFFSVVTHLLQEESFRYLRDAAGALKPGGRIVVSFLEMSKHWTIFKRFVDLYESDVVEPLVMFIERPAIETWADKLGLEVEKMTSFTPPGQSIAVLRRPL